MRVLLLAAGFGTRLRPLTDTMPKCLVPIRGVPLLQLWLQKLTDAGCGPFLINTHYLSKQVEDFIANSAFKDQVHLANETTLLGTAGTLMANIDFFSGEDGMLIHADNFFTGDITALIRAHRERPAGTLMTMLTFRTNAPETCGIVELNEHGIAVEFHEKKPNPPGNLANGATYILSKELLQKLRNEYPNSHDFSMEIIPELMGFIFTHETRSIFLDIGTPENYSIANNLP